MEGQTEAVGLLGGSFDPVHNGHTAIAQSFLNSGYISSLCVLVAPKPPHKKDNSLTSYPKRMEMLRRVFSDWDDVCLSDLEQNLPTPSYTVQTLEYLANEYPDTMFYWCVGGDSAQNFTSWHRWQDILDYCELLVAQRPTTESLALDPQVAQKAHIVDHEPLDISSTKVRNEVAKGNDISSLVTPAVLDFIKSENLYKNI